MKKIIVLGAGGFIGSHLVRKLKLMGNYVTGIDVKLPEFSATEADEFCKLDATNYQDLNKCIAEDTDEVYQLAADMGGAGYIFTGENDLNVMLNSATINLNVARIIKEKNIPMFFLAAARVYTLNIIRWMPTIQTAKNFQLTRQIQTQSMDGKNYLVRDCMLL